ncbi:AraC family transcriptional regulator [Chryseobacterium sp. sg2396]|uniref:helix-turn-helix domain-containing protein n=1 Tax=Chryseobacterium sp. sg2396 TaxID=3276280 RepID=UPI0025F87B4C|nr:AraC family transcriptional regulator [uncultured Chryseobacterium sp.]
MVRKLLFLIFFGIFTALLSQDGYNDFYKMREKYENFRENDHKAFPFLQSYINKAKKEKNYEKLVQGYKDGVFYSFSGEDKLKYADSMIWAANRSGNEDLRITSHIDKGVIYYYHYKKYQLALNEYLEAYKYSKNTKNEYLKYQNLYHIGVIKSYLGYYEEASDLFMKCLEHYREKTRQFTKLHPNEIYINKKGYLNSLYQMIICYRHLGKYKEADEAIQAGFSEIGEDSEFDLEKGYFLLSKGISEYRNSRFQPALKNLSEALPSIKTSRDFARLSVGYFYIGKSYSGLKKMKESIVYFKKIDSIFRQHQFMLPELRENYEILIDYSKKEKNQQLQLYYTNQLLRADSIMSKDFIYLSPKMHKDYDTNNLLEEKDKLQKINYLGTIIIIVLIVWAVGLVALLTRRHKNAKEIQQKYVLVEERFTAGHNTEEQEEVEIMPLIEEKKFSLNENKVEELLQKLKAFEEKKEFTQKGLTISKLAAQLGTNSNYLSQVINEYKKVNFNKYLSELRINYITNLLFEDKKYLKYNIETLARECGIASRQNFSDLFYEINGIRPTDFVKKRREEIENNGNI